MGKKTRDSDVAADFFGDDVGWLDDEADEAPAAPVRALDPPAAEVPEPVAPASAFAPFPGLGSAPTLVFSQVPTLPPVHDGPGDDAPATEPSTEAAARPDDAPGAVERVAEPLPEPAADEIEVVAIPVVPLPAPSTPPGAESRARRRAAQGSEPPEEVYGDSLDGESAPLVRTVEPHPARARLPVPQDPRVVPRATPAPVERVVARSWDVGDDAANWRNAAQILVTEAALAESDVRARWLAGAARIHQLRLGDQYAAEALYLDALGQGVGDSETLRSAADVARSLGHRGDAADLLERRGAAMQRGVEQAENDVEAAVLAWRGGRTAEARALLERALSGDAEDWRALSLLRDLCVETADASGVAAAQERMAGIAPGPVAAEVWVDRARAAEAAGQHAEAALAWERALDQRDGLLARAGRLRMLVRAEDQQGIAELAARVASRHPFAWVVAADAALAAGLDTAALGYLDAAVAAGVGVVEPEADALRVRIDPAARRTRLEALAPSDALSAWLLGQSLEADDRPSEAADWYARARALDSGCVPAWESEAVCLAKSGRLDDLRAHWHARLGAGEDEAKFRLALLADGSEAAAAWATLAAEPGVGGRVAQRGHVSAMLAAGIPDAVREAWAAEAPEGSAAWLIAAALAGPLGSNEATTHAERALAADPTLLPALDLLRHAWRDEPARRAAATLTAAASATDELAAALAWWAALDLVPSDPSAALDAARASANVPGFAAAATLVRELTRDPAERRSAWRALADRQPTAERWAWCSLASAMAGGLGPDSRADIERVRARLPGFPPASALATQLAAGERNLLALGSALMEESGGDGATVGPRTLRAALLAAAAGSPEVAEARLRSLARVPAGAAPHEDAAWVAAAWGRFDLAADLVQAARGDAVDLGDLYEMYLDRPLDAAGAFRAAGARVDGVLGRIRVAAHQQDLGARSLALSELADDTTVPAAVRASAALGVAMALAEAADPGELGAWQRLARLRPGSRLAFDGCLHAAIRARDGVEVRALFAAERPDDVVALGEALEQAGDLAGAADAARARASKGDGLGDALPALLASEIVLARVGDWAGVFNALTRRGEITCDENVASEVDLRRRWILKEKLAGTDEAWNLYRRLHDEVPEDREVTETLARIAAARGETALSIRYLTDLLRGQRDAAECARIQYRVGVAWSAAGNTTAARQAWLDALDHQQDHWESLGALKALADAEGDKAGRIAVLRREALLVDGPDRVARLHDIARAEADGAETGVALDAWRAVLDVVLDDVTALREVLRLSELAGDRASIVTHGEALGRALPPGSERASWFRKAASIAAEQHAQADALRLFELALDADPSDGESALKLEESYRARGDQASVARVLEIATQHVSGEHRKDVLHRRARFELDARMDREATARFYRAILEIDGRDEVALRFLSGHLYDTGRFDLALSIYESLEASMGSAEPDDFDARMELTQYLYRHGDLLRRAGRVDEALQRFERVLHLNSGHIATLEAVAPIYVERQDLQGAERTYRQLLQLSGGRGERAKIAGFYTQLGLVERRLGHVDKALKRFEKAVDVFPSYSPALKGLALVHEDRGDWSNALTVYNAIIGGAARSPEEVVDAYMTKGRLLDERMSRPDKAQQHYERCLEYEGNQPAAYLRLAELAMRRDEYAQAGQLCETALHLADAAAVARLRPLLLLGVAAGLSDGSNEGQARIAVDEALALDPTLAEGLADPPLSDLERLRLALRSRLTAGV